MAAFKECRSTEESAARIAGGKLWLSDFVAKVSSPQTLTLGGSCQKSICWFCLTICLQVKGSVLKPVVGFCKFHNESGTHRWAAWAADRLLLDCFKAVKTVGGVELAEEGGGEGWLYNQHVPRHNLLLGNHVTTLRFRAFHLRQNSM